MKNLIAFSVLLASASLLAQTPDSWRGMTLDQTTPEEAIEILGKPDKSKDRQKFHTVVGDWLDGDTRYRKLEFKDLDGIKKANLYFDGGTLQVIEIEPREKINPNSLGGAYGVKLIPKVSGLNIAFSPRDYERHEGQVYPKSYPLAYNLVGVAPGSFVVARVGQGTFSNFGKSIGGIQDDGSSFPGSVNMIQLISRELRDERGLDALK